MPAGEGADLQPVVVRGDDRVVRGAARAAVHDQGADDDEVEESPVELGEHDRKPVALVRERLGQLVDSDPAPAIEMEQRPLVRKQLEALGRPDGELGALLDPGERELAREPEQPGTDRLGADAEVVAGLGGLEHLVDSPSRGRRGPARARRAP